MTVQAAWSFIQLVRSDDALRAEIANAPGEPDLERLVAMGAAHGLAFTAEDLRAAHRFDWAARWHHEEKGP